MKTRIKKTRILTAIESGCKVRTFVVEMSDGTRWYTTEGGHVACCTEDPIKSYTNLDNVSDFDYFSYYGETAEYDGINTMEQFVRLVRMQ